MVALIILSARRDVMGDLATTRSTTAVMATAAVAVMGLNALLMANVFGVPPFLTSLTAERVQVIAAIEPIVAGFLCSSKPEVDDHRSRRSAGRLMLDAGLAPFPVREMSHYRIGLCQETAQSALAGTARRRCAPALPRR